MRKPARKNVHKKYFAFLQKALDKFCLLCYLTITKNTNNISGSNGTAKVGIDPARRIQYNVL